MRAFEDKAGFTTAYAWNIGGRNLCAVHWGTGIGSNAWRDADVLFLFDEFYLPKRVAVAHVQGLRGHNVHQGDLPTMETMKSKSFAVEIYALGTVYGGSSKWRYAGGLAVMMSMACAARCAW